MLLEAHEQVFAYTRNYGPVSALVLLNFNDGEVEVDLGEVSGGVAGYKSVLSNYDDNGNELEGSVTLRGYEGRVYLRATLLD